MIQVSVPVHPLSLRVLSAHYGQAPFILENHDPLFDLLSGSRVRATSRRDASNLTANASFLVCDELARHMAAHGHAIGVKLFRYHKQLLCWYAAAQVRARGKGVARPAIADWLQLHSVAEDEYGLDSAYKLWQRFGWNIQEKNPQFIGQMKRNTGARLSNKSRTCAKAVLATEPLTLRLRDIECELALSRFLTSYTHTFRRTPKVLPRHARVYVYVEQQHLSIRRAAEKLNMPHSTAAHAMVRMHALMRRNPTVQHLMRAAVGLPEPV